MRPKQEFIVWFSTATDVEELGMTVGAQKRANVSLLPGSGCFSVL